MKIGITINTSWNIFNFRKGLVQRLLTDGHEVFVIAPRDQYSEKLESWGCRFIHLDMDATGSNPLRELRLVGFYIRQMKKHSLELMLSYTIKPNIYASLASYFTKTRVIANVSGLGTAFLVDNWVSMVARSLYHLAFRKTFFVFFQNKEDRTEFLKKIPIEPEKTDILPGSGINLNEFIQAMYNPGQKLRFLMIGRLIIEKGVKEYAEAAVALSFTYPEHEFCLVGQFDPLHSRSVNDIFLQEWQNKGLLYLGPTDDIATQIKRADVIVLPSYREGTPRTLLEGAAIGRPLIATNVPGCREVVVDNHNGFLCEARSTIDLKEKMEAFIFLSTEEKKMMASKSREIAEKKFDENIVIQKYRDQIQAVSNRQM